MADKAFLKDLFSLEEKSKTAEKEKSTDADEKPKQRTLNQRAIAEEKPKPKEVHERKVVEKVIPTEIKFPDTIKFDLSDSMKSFFETTLKTVIEPILMKMEESNLPATKNLEKINLDTVLEESISAEEKEKRVPDELDKLESYHTLIGETMKAQHQTYRKMKQLFKE